MHRVENFLAGEVDLHPHLLGQGVHALVQLLMADTALGDIHQHDHGEHAMQNALGHVLNVDIQFAAKSRDFGDHANGIMTHDRDKCFHNFYPII